MKVSDFKNKKILTEFGSWKGSLYDTDELDNKLNSSGLVGVDNNTRKELEEISANHLTKDDVEFILEILNSLCKGSVMQQALANVLTYTTLRLVKGMPYSELYVDRLGFYCCEDEKYEVNYIGLLLKKIVDYVVDLSIDNGEFRTRYPLYEFLTDFSLKNKFKNVQDQLPDKIRNAEPRTLRKWVITKVLIHEMAHAFLDRDGKPHKSTLEESMANLITLSVADHFGDSCFFEFVKWFIGGQKANYSFALNLYEETVKRGLPPCGILVCADTWAREMVEGNIPLKVAAEHSIINDANSQGRKKLADEVIDELVKLSGSSTMSKEVKELEIKIWNILIRACNDNGLYLNVGKPGSVRVYTKLKNAYRDIDLKDIISDYIVFLNSGLSWKDRKKVLKGCNGYKGKIYKLLPKSKAELDSIQQD